MFLALPYQPSSISVPEPGFHTTSRIFRARLHRVVARNNLPCSSSQNNIDRSKIFPARIPAGGGKEKLCLASQVKDLAGQQKPTVRCWFMSFRPRLFIWKRVAQGPWQLLPSFLPSQPTVQHRTNALHSEPPFTSLLLFPCLSSNINFISELTPVPEPD